MDELTFFVSEQHKTKRFHVAVLLFSDRSHAVKMW